MTDTMTATVRHVNRTRGMVAAEVDGRGYVVLELLGDPEPAIGDVLTGIQYTHGRQTIQNRTQGRSVSVFVQALDATRTNAATLTT